MLKDGAFSRYDRESEWNKVKEQVILIWDAGEILLGYGEFLENNKFNQGGIIVGSLNLNDHLSVTGGMTVGTDFSMMPTLICTDTYILMYT